MKGLGNRLIREFVEAGGVYFGICAGAYYGAARVVFEKGQELEVIGDRELCFFAGNAEGPVYEKGIFRYAGETGRRTSYIHFDGSHYRTYYHGGCSFSGAAALEQVKTLATYADLPEEPAAIIGCKVGAGIAILSGVHLELPAPNKLAKGIDFGHLDLLKMLDADLLP